MCARARIPAPPHTVCLVAALADSPVAWSRRILDLEGNAALVCVPMSQDFLDSITNGYYGPGYYGPGPCEVSSSPSFRIDVKNVAVAS